jgi:hypothetical protein
MTRRNHFTPRLYLKHFAGQDGKLLVYRTLVPDSRVPHWKPSTPAGIGYIEHLYTRTAADHDTDEIETWLKHDYEDPAVMPLQKAVADQRLTCKDWDCLIHLLAAQIVRTPAYFVRSLPHWQAQTPEWLNATLQDAVLQLRAGNRLSPLPAHDYAEYLPVHVERTIDTNASDGTLKASMVVGRGLWLFTMRTVLAGAGTQALHNHHWSILAPHDRLDWPTSDDPVILLNYQGDGSYDFGGGTGSTGTEIFFPLSPRHMLYTRIGERPPRRGSQFPLDDTRKIRHIIAEHAYRFVLANSRDNEIPHIRPRVANSQQFREEQSWWQRWHEEQNAAELQLAEARKQPL